MPCSSACHRYTSWLGTPHRPARISVHLLFITAHVLNTQHELQPQLHSHHFAPLQSQHTPNSNHSKCPYTTAAVHALWPPRLPSAASGCAQGFWAVCTSMSGAQLYESVCVQ
eukprot:scaffold58956_cov19-Tisochrysis_lutea.AAC.1